MLAYIQTLPQAATWHHFFTWFRLVVTGDQRGMIDLLRNFSSEERAHALFFLRAMNNLGRQAQAWLQNDRRYRAPSPEQEDVLQICRFVCYEECDIRKQWGDLNYALPRGGVIPELLRLRTPAWFVEVFSHYLERLGINYEIGIACERAGSPILNPASTASRLSRFLWETVRHRSDRQALYREYPEIFSRDIWTLFREKAFSLADAQSSAAIVVIDGINAGKLERDRVLRECLLGACRHLEKHQCAGFLKFFHRLRPTQEELLEMQDELIAVLRLPHTDPATVALKHVKTILPHQDFHDAAFLEALPLLLCSSRKALRMTALTTAEKLARHRPAIRSALMGAVTPVFSVPEETTQVRAAKLLKTYGDANEKQLRAELAALWQSITVAAKDLLGAFLDPSTARAFETAKTLSAPFSGGVCHLDENRRIALPETLDDCLFILTEAFGNPAEYHCSLVPDALFAVRNQLDDASLVRLGPAIAAARTRAATLDVGHPVHARTPALHFLRYCAERLAASSGNGLTALKKTLPAIVRESSSPYTFFIRRKHEKEHRVCCFLPLFTTFSSLNEVVEAAFARLRTGDVLPMLSSVTHAPCWIDPVVLIDRLLAWQKAGREPHVMDMQLALQRCARENISEALRAAHALTGEYRALLEYFLGDGSAAPSFPRQHHAWWLTAALMRPERRVPPEYRGTEYAGIPGEYLGEPFGWNVVPRKTTGGIGDIEFLTTPVQQIHVALPRAKYAPDFLFFEDIEEISVSGKWREIFGGRMFLGQDASLLHQALMLYPNNPEPVVMDCLAAYRREKHWRVRAVFEKLLELRVPQGPASNLFLALGFLSREKDLRLRAAAFWRVKVEEGTIRNTDLGQVLGRLERHNWRPTKRFTDVVEKEMLAVSPLHSSALATLLEAMLIEIGPEPPVNIKRILELWYELQGLLGLRLNAAMPPLLDAWEKEKKYAACVQKLRTLER